MRHTIWFTAAALGSAAGALTLTAATVLPPKRGAAAPPTVAAPQKALTARVTDAFGTVEKQVSGAKTWKPVSTGDLLSAQTTLRTGADAACLLQLSGGHVLRVGAKTTVLLRDLGNSNQYSFKVLSGQVWSMVRKANKPTRYEVETPSAVAGVTGTIFGVAIDEATGETTVSTEEGSVAVRQERAAEVRAPWKPQPVLAGYFVRIPRWHAHGVTLARRTGVGTGAGGGTRIGKGHVASAPPPSAPFSPQRQSPRMQQMWRLLRQEGVLLHGHSGGPIPPPSRLHLHRRIEGSLRNGWAIIERNGPPPLGGPYARPPRR